MCNVRMAAFGSYSVQHVAVGRVHSEGGCPLLNYEGPRCTVCVSGTVGQLPRMPQQRNQSNISCGTLIIVIIKELQVVTKRRAPSCNNAGINKTIKILHFVDRASCNEFW
jgi:hypothetical protein